MKPAIAQLIVVLLSASLAWELAALVGETSWRWALFAALLAATTFLVVALFRKPLRRVEAKLRGTASRGLVGLIGGGSVVASGFILLAEGVERTGGVLVVAGLAVALIGLFHLATASRRRLLH